MIGWGLIYLISPNIFNFAWRKELQSLFLFSYSIMLTTTLALLTVLLLEYILVGPEKSSLKRIFRPDASMLRDQICWILAATGLNSNIGFFLTLGLNFFLGDYLILVFPQLKKLSFINTFESPFLRVIIGFILLDLFQYLAHRILHTFDPLWKFHQYHHSNEKMTVFSGQRGPPFNVRKIVAAIPIRFFGCNMVEFLWVYFLLDILTNLTHSEIDADWGWLGKWVFISPRFHRIHHSRDAGSERCNYGISLVIWDRIFRSYNPHAVVTNIGLNEVDYNRMPIFEGFFHGIQSIIFKRKRIIH